MAACKVRFSVARALRARCDACVCVCVCSKRSTEPIVVLEIDEHQHKGRGWDNERAREVFVLQKLKSMHPGCTRITIIRFNPHEYNTAVQPAAAPPARRSQRIARAAAKQQQQVRQGPEEQEEEEPDPPNAKYVTEPDRNERLHQLSRLIQYGLARDTEYAGVQVTILFAYYDKRWETEDYQDIVGYNYKSIEKYQEDVQNGSGRYQRWISRKMFYHPRFWVYPVPQAAGQVVKWTEKLDASKEVSKLQKEG